MARVYLPPEDMPPPETDFKNYDFDAETAKAKEWTDALAKRLRATYKGDLVGEILYVGRGDGYAHYMIAQHRPFTLIWLPGGDNWRADAIWERGVNLKDARGMIERDRALRELFTNK